MTTVPKAIHREADAEHRIVDTVNGTSDHRATRVAWLVASGATAVMAMIFWQARDFVYDDAYISLRYAKNLVLHGDLVWNLGESVEGYTNFLFVISSAVLIALGVPATLAAQSLALSSFACALALTVLILRRLPVGSLGVAVGFAAVAGSISLPAWAMSGMEAPMVAALVTATLWAVLPLAGGGQLSDRRAFLAGLFGALAFLTRMDAAVPIAVVTTTLAVASPVPVRQRLRVILIVGSLGCLAFLLQTTWRFVYYDSLLPNTFFAKVDVPFHLRLDASVRYLQTTLAQLPFLVLSLLVSLAGTASRSIEGAGRSIHLACFAGVLSQIAYVCVIGGDHLPAGRFLAPVLPLAAIALGIGLQAWSFELRASASLITLVAAALAAAVATPKVHSGAEAGLVVGSYIRDTVPVDQTIALNLAGATPFVAEDHRFIDMQGLNDATIGRRTDVPLRSVWQRRPGHAKGDGSYVLSRAPDIIIVGGAVGDLIHDGYHIGEIELADLDGFHACYEPRFAAIPSAETDLYRVAGGPTEVKFTYYERVCADSAGAIIGDQGLAGSPRGRPERSDPQRTSRGASTVD